MTANRFDAPHRRRLSVLKRTVWILLIAGVAGSPAYGQVILNEILYDTPLGDDVHVMFTELYGPPAMDLTGWRLVGINGATGQPYRTDILQGLIPSSGYFVIGGDGVPNRNQTANIDWQNAGFGTPGDCDGIDLRTPADIIVDHLCYGPCSVPSYCVGEGGANGPDVYPDGNINYSIARIPDRTNTGQNSLDWLATATLTPGAPNAADVACTEIMPDPALVGVSDSLGEWFEIYNASSRTLDLSGWVLVDSYGSDTIRTALTLAPGHYAVFCSNADSAINGGVPEDFAYLYGHAPGMGLALNNSGDTLTIKTPFGNPLARAAYTTASPWAPGRSMQLRNPGFNALLDSNWCRAEYRWTGGTNGNFGSPHAAANCVVPPPDSVTVCAIRQQDACGYPNELHARVVTCGRVSFADSCRQIAYLQDGGCAVAIYGSAVTSIMENSTRRVAAGDSIRVNGYLRQFSGKSQITLYDEVPPVIHFISAGRPIAPFDLDAALVSTSANSCEGEPYESRYVRVGPVTFAEAGGIFAGETGYLASSGSNTLRYFVSACDPLVGETIPAGPVMITGIVVQYDATACYCGGYELEFAVTAAECVAPIALTAIRDTVTTDRVLHWQPGVNQPCDCFDIYYAVDAAAPFPAGYTYLAHVTGTYEYVDTDALAARRFYVITAGGPGCP